MWLKNLDLRLFDKQVLSATGGMLSDKHMRAAHGTIIDAILQL